MKNITVSSPVAELKGVGEVRRKALLRLGIETVGDLLRHYPRAYQNRGDTKNLDEIRKMMSPGTRETVASVKLTVSSTPDARMIRRGMNILKFRAFDEFGTVEITYFNQNYLKDTFTVGSEFRFWGKIERDGASFKMTSPIYEPCDTGEELMSLVPVYPLASGITQKFLHGIIKTSIDEAGDSLDDPFTEEFCGRYGIETLKSAIRKIHAPATLEEMEAARRRLCFESVFMTAAALATERCRRAGESAPALKDTDISEYTSALPYKLTGAQDRSLSEILSDMTKSEPMRRILIGDVGSGKTAVACGAAFAAVKNGYQCAIMVPTEILANQHYEDMRATLSPLGINVALLTGSLSQGEKKRVRAVLSGETTDLTGKIDIVVGTHALITDDVKFERLGLVITDEQHRFGVMQRASLADKTDGVHVLAMSATPIPRTLSLVYYGDLALSRLDEMPPGRQRVETYVVDERYTDRINRFIRTHAKAGNRTYIVCPMVEESEVKVRAASAEKRGDDPEEMANVFLVDDINASSPLKSTVEFARETALRLPDLRIGTVHGKMKPAQKEAVMNDFCAGNYDVLVATTVIEVGVNVPEATLMIVENAERFGLSQLHQLRGRVGRSERKSFCILVSDSKSAKAAERLNVMKTTYDGFAIAEYDLKLRGAGDFFSPEGRIRQHGDASTMITDSEEDREATSLAVSAAHETVMRDPDLTLPENRGIKERVSHLRAGIENTIS
ncbi:MAG: ATP-dependent DNA helicase RecG [Clostridia bacterium]|nr:ATP-dependent DNA helicase RecG [Clostridia bacterium]